MILTLRKRWLILLPLLAAVIVATVALSPRQTNGVRLPVLMYHHLSEKPGALGPYVVTPAQFRSDLLYMRERGYETVTAAQLIDYVDGKGTLPEKPVLITFDDGYESFYAYAYPILQELNEKALLSVIGVYTEQYSTGDDHNVAYAHVTWDEIAEMAGSGLVEIGNHTYDLHTLTDRKGCRIKPGESEAAYRAMLTADVQALQDRLTAVTGQAPAVFTFPYGNVCSQSCEVVEAMGFRVTLVCEEKVNIVTQGDPDCLKKLRRFNRAHGKSSQSFLSAILDE
ncbi:MAG: polysaccharide deacetylase family protein [Clostridia bacterium]|nr:polysaccharide deacetylase family protein [Clostridia bacterium]